MAQQHDPETVQAIKMMAHTPVYFEGGRIAFEENGGIELYKNGQLVDEMKPGKEDAAVTALNMWRELSTMPEKMLLSIMKKLDPNKVETGQRILESLMENGHGILF